MNEWMNWIEWFGKPSCQVNSCRSPNECTHTLSTNGQEFSIQMEEAISNWWKSQSIPVESYQQGYKQGTWETPYFELTIQAGFKKLFWIDPVLLKKLQNRRKSMLCFPLQSVLCLSMFNHTILICHLSARIQDCRSHLYICIFITCGFYNISHHMGHSSYNTGR